MISCFPCPLGGIKVRTGGTLPKSEDDGFAGGGVAGIPAQQMNRIVSGLREGSLRMGRLYLPRTIVQNSPMIPNVLVEW
jgi:hypothetical protein